MSKSKKKNKGYKISIDNPLVIIVSLILIISSFYYKDTFYFIIGLLIISFYYLSLPKLGIKFDFKKKNHNRSVKKIKGVNFKELFSHSLFINLTLINLIFFTYLCKYHWELVDSKNIFIAHLNSFLNFLLKNQKISLGLAVIIFLSLIFVFYRNGKKAYHHIVSILLSTLLSIVGSLLVVLFLAFLQLNLLPLKVNGSPELIWGNEKIVEKLKDDGVLPQVINGEENFQQIIRDSFKNNNYTDNSYYSQNILKLIPQNIIFTSIDEVGGVVLIKNKLIFRKIEKEEIENLSPMLGKLYVQNYLEDRYVKDVPKIEVLGRQEYLKYREDQLNERILVLKDYLYKAETLLNQTYGYIDDERSNTSYYQSEIDGAVYNRDQDYQYCKTTGYYTYYYNPGFHRYYSDDQCEKKNNEWNDYIAGMDSKINESQELLRSYQSQAAEYVDYIDIFSEYISLVESQKDQTIYELGIFEADDSKIKIALDFTSSSTLADYLSTLVHEYFHYTSYVSEEKTLPLFFEEALTEYFSRKAIIQELDINTHLGYPVLIKVIDKIVDDIGEENLQSIYLTKDEDSLLNFLNEQYGDDFYQDSEFYFMLLPYLPPQDQLKIANNLLMRLGGDQINEEDLYSKRSNF
jgi:hypothetical protein